MREVVLMAAETVEELEALPLGTSILSADSTVWIHEETGAGQRYWIVDVTLVPSRPREEWLPALILPEAR